MLRWIPPSQPFLPQAQNRRFPAPEERSKALATPCLPTWEFTGPQFYWQQVSFHKKTRAHLVKNAPHSGQGLNTAQNRQREPLQTTDLKDKEAGTQCRHSQKHWVLENRGHYTAGHYRDFLSFEPLPARIGENFPNTEKQEQTSTK